MTADYIHAGVFVPLLQASEDADRFSFSPLGNSSTKLLYWDKEAYVSELLVSSGSPNTDTVDNQARSAADEAVAAAEGEGLVKPGKESDAKAKKRKAEAGNMSKPKKASN